MAAEIIERILSGFTWKEAQLRKSHKLENSQPEQAYTTDKGINLNKNYSRYKLNKIVQIIHSRHCLENSLENSLYESQVEFYG